MSVDPSIVAAVATVASAVLLAIPATMAAVFSRQNSQKLKTSNGMTVGEHAENSAKAARQVATELADYKLAQAEQSTRALDAIEAHIVSDTEQFAALRDLIAGEGN